MCVSSYHRTTPSYTSRAAGQTRQAHLEQRASGTYHRKLPLSAESEWPSQITATRACAKMGVHIVQEFILTNQELCSVFWSPLSFHVRLFSTLWGT